MPLTPRRQIEISLEALSMFVDIHIQPLIGDLDLSGVLTNTMEEIDKLLDEMEAKQ